MKTAGAVVAGMIVVGGAFLFGSSMVDAKKSDTGLVEYRDAKAGWTIDYPKAWRRLEPKDPDVALVVSEAPAEQNTGGSILARNLTLGAPVSDANLAAAKQVTDKIVTGDGIEHITQPQVLHQAGLPGYFYFYRFKDPASGRVGVHSHYFLFKGATMISFVFQALPDGDFKRLATLYDTVIGSFREGSLNAAG